MCSGQFYVCQEKGHRANQCPNREANKVELGGMARALTRNATTVDSKDNRNRSVGNCQRMQERGLVDTS